MQATIVGGLHGTIVDGADNSAISGATVKAANGATTVTVSDGTFVLTGADANSTLSISKTGSYEPADYYGAISSATTITELGNIPLATASADDDAVVSGRVLDLTSGPIPGARVAIRHGANHAQDSEFEFTTTNSDGNYSFTNLHSGTYTMTVTMSGYTSVSTTFTVRHNNTTTLSITLSPSSSR
jgi:protocatechuate 3,4-dioxygenase beta subunit